MSHIKREIHYILRFICTGRKKKLFQKCFFFLAIHMWRMVDAKIASWKVDAMMNGCLRNNVKSYIKWNILYVRFIWDCISMFGGNISVMIYFEMNNSYIKYKQWCKCSNINVVNVITLWRLLKWRPPPLVVQWYCKVQQFFQISKELHKVKLRFRENFI